MPSSRRITLKDLAKAAGLSKSGVSLALRNHPSVSKATRVRVRLLADKMGYRPDPALSALSSYRNSSHVPVAETLGWVTNWPTKDGWSETSPVYEQYFVGASRRAEQSGYRLEHFWLRESGMSRTRFEQILRARNIRGLLLAPLPAPHTPVNLTWSRYAAVTIGYTVSQPPLNMVACAHFRSMITVMDQLRRRGYRRIGCALPNSIDARVEHAWLAGYLLDQQKHPEDLKVPPLQLRVSQRKCFCKWIETHRPDAVVTVGGGCVDTVHDWCLKLGLAVPGDCGLAVVSNVPLYGEVTGIHDPSQEIGEAAVEVLTGMLFRNELGLPERPRRTLLDGIWVSGKTVNHRV